MVVGAARAGVCRSLQQTTAASSVDFGHLSASCVVVVDLGDELLGNGQLQLWQRQEGTTVTRMDG